MMPLIAAAFGIVLVLQVVSLIGLWWVTTEVKGMQKSTHQVQFVPADSQFQKISDEVKETLQKDIFENLA